MSTPRLLGLQVDMQTLDRAMLRFRLNPTPGSHYWAWKWWRLMTRKVKDAGSSWFLTKEERFFVRVCRVRLPGLELELIAPLRYAGYKTDLIPDLLYGLTPVPPMPVKESWKELEQKAEFAVYWLAVYKADDTAGGPFLKALEAVREYERALLHHVARLPRWSLVDLALDGPLAWYAVYRVKVHAVRRREMQHEMIEQNAGRWAFPQ